MMTTNEPALLGDHNRPLLEAIYKSECKLDKSKDKFKKKPFIGAVNKDLNVDTQAYHGTITKFDEDEIIFFIDDIIPKDLRLPNLIFPIFVGNQFGQFLLINLAGKIKPTLILGADLFDFFNKKIKLVFKKSRFGLNSVQFNLSDDKFIPEAISKIKKALDKRGKNVIQNNDLCVLSELAPRVEKTGTSTKIQKIQSAYYRRMENVMDAHFEYIIHEKEIILELYGLFNLHIREKFPVTFAMLEVHKSYFSTQDRTELISFCFGLSAEKLYTECYIGEYTVMNLIWDASGYSKEVANDKLGKCLNDLQHLVTLSPKVTKFGEKLPVVSLKGGPILKFIDVLKSNSIKPEAFWMDPHCDLYFFDEVVYGDEYPISLEEFYIEFDSYFDTQTSANEISLTANQLYDEAVSSKTGLIPPKAFVCLEVGFFSGVEIFERAENIIFKWIRSDGGFIILYINKFTADEGIQTPIVRFGFETFRRSHLSENLRQSQIKIDKLEIAEANLRLLSIAMLRDFWVYEERGSSYQETLRTNLPRSIAQNTPKKFKIVYLPRKRYSNKKSCKNILQELQLETRARHVVQQHFRKTKASVAQRHVAKLMKVDLPEGHTLVTTHFRGDEAKQVIYKSKSALEALCGSLNKTVVRYSINKTWFDFEQDVMLLHKKLGFKILTQATSGLGDGGIDTLAQKIFDDGAQYKIIQCKKWTRPIGPSIVREIIGTLEDFRTTETNSATASIFTTSYFTSEASDLAARHKIELIDGTMWTKIIEG